MAKILGINALAYIGGAELPQRNAWSLSISRELTEGRVFQASGAAASWVDQAAGFKSWSGSINGYYDDNSTSMQGLVLGTASTARQSIHLYENRSTLANYWYGTIWAEINEDVGTDGFIELNVDFTGDGELKRFPAPS